MIAVDTCSFVAWLEGDRGRDVDLVQQAMEAQTLVLPQVVLCELLSAPALLAEDEERILLLATLPTTDGYWQRAAWLRRQILRKQRKARLADTLVAQSCIDHGVPLVTRDGDFKNFAPVDGLRFL